MMKWKLAKYAVWLVLMSPIIAVNIWGARMSIWTGQFQAENQAVISGKKDSIDIPVMPTSPLDWISKKAKKSKSFNTEDLNSGRQISISKRIHFEEVLRVGEEAPEDVFKPLFVEARAQQLLSSYCQVAFGNLATRCAVKSSETSASRNGYYNVSGRLNYVPNYDVGKPLNIDGGEFIRTRLQLGDESDITNIEAEVGVMMRQAKEVCQRLKTQYGSCILSNFAVSETSADRETGADIASISKSISVAAVFEVYANKDQLSRNELENFTKKLAEEVLTR